MQISMIGTGYVGLIARLGFARLGHTVTCFDNNSEKINSLNANEMPFYEAQATGMLKRFRSKKINQRTKPPLIVFKSTLPIGSHLKLSKQFPKLNLVTNPEFLSQGLTVENFLKPARIILGTLAPWIPAVTLTTGIERMQIYLQGVLKNDL